MQSDRGQNNFCKANYVARICSAEERFRVLNTGVIELGVRIPITGNILPTNCTNAQKRGGNPEAMRFENEPCGATLAVQRAYY